MVIILYGITNCDTVRKAHKFLESAQKEFVFHDFRKDGLTEARIKSWLKLVSWEDLLNKRSRSFRELDVNHRNNLNKQQAIKLMLKNPTLIKRPVLEFDGQLLVGFKADTYQEFL